MGKGAAKMWKLRKLRKMLLALSLIYWSYSLKDLSSEGYVGRSSPRTAMTSSAANAQGKLSSFLPSCEVLEDLGVYAWKPPGQDPKALQDVTVDDIQRGLQATDSANRLVDLERLQLPVSFCDASELPLCTAAAKFPFTGGFMASLHVAVCRKGLDLKKIDFVIGGSILGFLSGQGKMRKTYLAQICPGTKIMVIGQSKNYEQNFGEKGYQFERLVTGQDMYGMHDLTTHEHLQLFRIGTFNVLVEAEVDAMDSQGRLVEIKTGNPRWFDVKELLQMISSGSQQLIHPYTRGPEVTEIVLKPLEDLAQEVGL